MPISSTEARAIRDTIASVFNAHAGISPATTRSLLPIKDLQGKLYEARVLSCLVRDLVIHEHCTITLINTEGTAFKFKQKGSAINKRFPYFEVYDRQGDLFGEIFTDTEFTTVSFEHLSHSVPNNADYHELDVVMFTPNQTRRPSYQHVMLAIECKATELGKNTFRELLGYRRELGYFSPGEHQTYFSNWPCNRIKSHPGNYIIPSSVYMCYSTHNTVNRYIDNGEAFGIIMKQEHIR